MIDELSVDKIFVLATSFEQLHVGSSLNYRALIHDKNLVGLHYSAQTMRYDNDGLFT